MLVQLLHETTGFLLLQAGAGVPFVDVLTTMLDETIPLTTIEFEEWGNPQVSPAGTMFMHSRVGWDSLLTQQAADANLLCAAGPKIL